MLIVKEVSGRHRRDVGYHAAANKGVTDGYGALVGRLQANEMVNELVLTRLQVLGDFGRILRPEHFVGHEVGPGLEALGR